jgi:phage shock protein E
MSLFQHAQGNEHTATLQNMIEKGAFLVDVREPIEFAAGTAKGAVNIPLGSIASNLEQFKGKASIVVFCRSGNRSGQAKIILEQNGFKQVVNGGTWEEVNQLIK